MKKITSLTSLATVLTLIGCATDLPDQQGGEEGGQPSAGDGDSTATDGSSQNGAQPGGATPGVDGNPTGMNGAPGADTPGDSGDGTAMTPADPGMIPTTPGTDSGPLTARGTRYCEGQTIDLGEIHLFNNEWTDEAADTCVFLDQDGTFGIEWTRGATGSGDNPNYPNYPEAEFGINPWNASGLDKSSTAELPLQLKDFTSASMTIDVTTTTTTNNGWNLAFELWLSDTDPTLGPANPKAEIMVFLGNEPGYYPPNPVGGTLNDGHNDYTLYESQSPWGEWDHYRQWRIGDTDGTVDFNGTLDIMAFLRHHMDNEGWDQNLWVTRFEIGNETFQNSGGKTTFRNLCFEVNGVEKCAVTE